MSTWAVKTAISQANDNQATGLHTRWRSGLTSVRQRLPGIQLDGDRGGELGERGQTIREPDRPVPVPRPVAFLLRGSGFRWRLDRNSVDGRRGGTAASRSPRRVYDRFHQGEWNARVVASRRLATLRSVNRLRTRSITSIGPVGTVSSGPREVLRPAVGGRGRCRPISRTPGTLQHDPKHLGTLSVTGTRGFPGARLRQRRVSRFVVARYF